ncbi:hypothetical protein BASA60_000278 [Batrachochytrium salamandrivorans]|nr:hypothetical protein BASA60_000278 [Batrachochytrium salamandrivorans]KAH9250541.1 hypothetical protein BASA81_011647 [Batrachochytrium salamandrivorans]KAH9275632.1 hypothetical protein BASA83_001920 [Batrachochytrium salamandrivorans]
MQFFHLFSFVVVASYAAALPQPAGLSEQYSNSADSNLVSGLEARSYQPALNSYKESAALMSLKRRDSSDGSSGEKSGSRTPPPSTLSPEETQKIIDNAFTKSEVSSKNLASTIDNVGDGVFNFYEDGERAGKMIGGPLGDKVARYIRRSVYVTGVIQGWIKHSASGILGLMKSGLGDEGYSRILPDFIKTSKQLTVEFKAGMKAAAEAVSNILNNVGSDIENVQKIDESFDRTFYSRTLLFWELRPLLARFEAGRTLNGDLADIGRSLGKFVTEQQSIHDEIMKELRAASS